MSPTEQCNKYHANGFVRSALQVSRPELAHRVPAYSRTGHINARSLVPLGFVEHETSITRLRGPSASGSPGHHRLSCSMTLAI